MLDALLRAPSSLKAPLEDPCEARPFALLAVGAADLREQLLLELGLGLSELQREPDEQLVAVRCVRPFAAREPLEERTPADLQLRRDALHRLRGEHRGTNASK